MVLVDRDLDEHQHGHHRFRLDPNIYFNMLDTES